MLLRYESLKSSVNLNDIVSLIEIVGDETLTISESWNSSLSLDENEMSLFKIFCPLALLLNDISNKIIDLAYWNEIGLDSSTIIPFKFSMKYNLVESFLWNKRRRARIEKRQIR